MFGCKKGAVAAAAATMFIALFSWQKKLVLDIVTISFVFDNYCPTIS